MTTTPRQISEQSVVLAMDYGQFLVTGGFGDPDAELALLDQAQADQPCAGDGDSLLVLSPHQNNFTMPVRAQVWDARPPADREDWQQVCEGSILVREAGQLTIMAPTMSIETIDGVAPGDYLIEVAGRGFVNYGWPGSTTPGDEWRIRLWPTVGGEPLPAQLWDMPGYGIPENVPIPEPAPPIEPEDPWVTIWSPGGETRVARRSELAAGALDRERQKWGGEPIPELVGYNGGQRLSGHDRALVDALLALDEKTQRRVAIWCATQAFALAEIAELAPVPAALAAIEAGDPPPAPFDDMPAAWRWLQRAEAAEARAEESGEPQGTWMVLVEDPTEPGPNPFAGPVHRPSYALPTIFSAADPNPRRAAIEALHHASGTFADDAADLHARLRAEFGLPPA